MTTSPPVATPAAHHQPAAHPVRFWSRAVQEGLRAVGLITLVLLVPLTILPMLGQPAVQTTAGRWGFVLLLAGHVLTAAALLRRRRSRPLLVALTGMMLLSMALIVPSRHLFRTNDLYCPGWWSIPLLAYALVVLDLDEHRRYLLPAIPLAVAVELSGPLFFWPMTALRATDEVFVVQPLAIFYLFGRGLLSMARDHDRAGERVAALRASHTAQRAEHEGRREAARILHDHVLHALHAVAEDRTLVPASEAVRECRDTLEQLERPSEAPRMVSLHDELEEDPVVVRVAGQVTGNAQPLPDAVASTIAAATHEALVNVERHAQARHATVELQTVGDDGCRVTVSDDGRGFDPARQAGGRLGIRDSVVGRMADIGGHAEVASAPGAGTVVTLSWPHTGRAEQAPSLADHTRTATRRALTACAWPGLVATACMLVLLAPLLPGSAPLVAMTVACLAVGVHNSIRLRDGGLGVTAVAVTLVLATLAWVTNLLVVPDNPTSIYLLWMAWCITPMVQLAMLSCSTNVAIAMGTALPLVMASTLVLRFGAGYAARHLVGSVAATSMIVLVGYGAMMIAQRIAGQADNQTRSFERVRDATARMHHLARVEHFWSDRVTQDALPLIRSVAAGDLDPADGRVRRAARCMESSVRDELVLGPGQHGLSDELARLRAAGWLVQSSLTGDDGPSLLETAARLARGLDVPAHPGQLVTMSAHGAGVTVVVLDATDEQVQDWARMMNDIGGHMDHDPDFVRMAVGAR